MKRIILLLILLQSTILLTYNQEKPNGFEPGGKPLALIFTNFHTHFTESNTVPAFEITRAYFGYEYNLSENWYAKAVIDVGNPGVGKYEMSAYLKNAYFKYNKSKFTAYFGMIPTTQFTVSEKIWGHRYIEKSYQDAYEYNSSADLGFNIEYAFTDFLSIDFSVINGEGYKEIQRDKFLRPGAGITIKPIKNIVARVYVDYLGDEVKQQSLSTFFAYKGEKFIAGAEYNYQQNTDMIKGQDRYGTSFFFTFKPTGTIGMFGRFDDLNSKRLMGGNDPLKINENGRLFMAGLEFLLVKGVKLAPNFRLWYPENAFSESVNSVYLNCEIRF